jgi:hypothetical protein
MVRTVLNPRRLLLAGVAIGYVLVRSLNRLTRRSAAESEWRLAVSGLEGTSRTAL